MLRMKRFIAHLLLILCGIAGSSFAATSDIQIHLYNDLIETSIALEGVHSDYSAFPVGLNSQNLTIPYNNTSKPVEVTFKSFAKDHIKLLTNNSKIDFVTYKLPQDVSVEDAQSIYLLINSYNTFEVGYGQQGGAINRTIGHIELILDDGTVIDSGSIPNSELVVGKNISDIWEGTSGNYRIFSDLFSSIIWNGNSNKLNMLRIELDNLSSYNGKLAKIRVKADKVFQLLTPSGYYPPVSAYGGIRLMGITVKRFSCDPKLALSVDGSWYLWGGKGWDYSLRNWADPDEVLFFPGYKYYNSVMNNFIFGQGVDCSGLVMWACNKPSGYQIGDKRNPVLYEGADGQFWNNSSPVWSEADLRPGDLLFFDWNSDARMDHVAMYVGGHDVMEAKGKNDGVVKSSLDELKNKNGFVGFRRIATPRIGINVVVNSPVSIIVTDPDGFKISPDTIIDTDEELLREIPKVLYYSVIDIDQDGHSQDMVYSPLLKTGNYLIRVVPKPEAFPTDTYGLTVSTAETQIVLAQNVPISDIPAKGYGIYSNGSVISTVTLVVGDVDGDGKVNCSDLSKIKTSFGKKIGQIGFNAWADVNSDEIVDIRDLTIVSRKLETGTRCQ